MCPYQFYKENEVYYPRLYCKLRDDTASSYCIYSKRCDKERKYISLDVDKNECKYMIIEKRNNIPTGSFFVRTYKLRPNGTYTLYVEINGAVEKVNTSFTEFNQNYIYLREENGVYTASLTPIVVEKQPQKINPKKGRPMKSVEKQD